MTELGSDYNNDREDLGVIRKFLETLRDNEIDCPVVDATRDVLRIFADKYSDHVCEGQFCLDHNPCSENWAKVEEGKMIYVSDYETTFFISQRYARVARIIEDCFAILDEFEGK